jgi:benzodiazapine receptor
VTTNLSTEPRSADALRRLRLPHTPNVRPQRLHQMPRRSVTKDVLGLAAWLAATFAAAGTGAVAAASAAPFYGSLAQPSWAPPAAVFGPVWTALYVLMGVSAWLVWRRHGFSGAGTALRLFAIQLLANALWSWLFFEWRLGSAALLEIVVLWLLIAATIHAFWPLHRLAAVLLVPYLAWVSFASALTLSLWRLNPSALAG